MIVSRKTIEEQDGVHMMEKVTWGSSALGGTCVPGLANPRGHGELSERPGWSAQVIRKTELNTSRISLFIRPQGEVSIWTQSQEMYLLKSNWHVSV